MSIFRTPPINNTKQNSLRYNTILQGKYGLQSRWTD